MKNASQKGMGYTTIFSLALTILFLILSLLYQRDVWFSLTITMGTILYHFAMRLFVGWAVKVWGKRDFKVENAWFRPQKWEPHFYKLLHVKKWKQKMPTYLPDHFSIEKHSVDEIIQTMCISEIGHEIMIVLGYVPLLFSLFTSDWQRYLWIFAITSVVTGCIDFLFVILQRYNRPRLLLLKKKIQQRKQK